MEDFKQRCDRMEENLNKRYDRLEKQIDNFINNSSRRANRFEERINKLEQAGEGRDARMSGLARELESFGKHLDRMENTLLSEFKVSQDIIKSMLQNEWAIDKAKMDMKHEMERREADLKAQQDQLALDTQRERGEMRRKLLLQFGVIGLPVLTALATALSLLIEKMFQ